jgi:uncharacterized protein (TIGR03083 family)
VTILDRDRVVAALDEAFDEFTGLAEELAPDEWDLATACPGWSVKDNVSHIIGIEATLLDKPTPDIALPDDMPHMRNDFGRFNELWVESYRRRSTADVLADLHGVIAERRKVLAGMDQSAFDRDAATPAGPDTYGRFMRIRTMDIWFHDQDIREAAGRPGHLEGLAPTAALDEVALVIGFVVGKRVGAPAGSSVRFELTGPLVRRIDVEVTDRARVVDQLVGEPTVTLTVAGDHFMRLCGGRASDPSVVAIDGDRALGEVVVAHLGFMM